MQETASRRLPTSKSKRAFRSTHLGTVRLTTRYHPFQADTFSLFNELLERHQPRRGSLRGGLSDPAPLTASVPSRRHPYKIKPRAKNGTTGEKSCNLLIYSELWRSNAGTDKMAEI